MVDAESLCGVSAVALGARAAAGLAAAEGGRLEGQNKRLN